MLKIFNYISRSYAPLPDTVKQRAAWISGASGLILALCGAFVLAKYSIFRRFEKVKLTVGLSAIGLGSACETVAIIALITLNRTDSPPRSTKTPFSQDKEPTSPSTAPTQPSHLSTETPLSQDRQPSPPTTPQRLPNPAIKTPPSSQNRQMIPPTISPTSPTSSQQIALANFRACASELAPHDQLFLKSMAQKFLQLLHDPKCRLSSLTDYSSMDQRNNIPKENLLDMLDNLEDETLARLSSQTYKMREESVLIQELLSYSSIGSNTSDLALLSGQTLIQNCYNSHTELTKIIAMLSEEKRLTPSDNGH